MEAKAIKGSFNVVGTAYSNFSHVAPLLRVGDDISLTRDPENKYDTQAVEVHWIPVRGPMQKQMVKLGFIPRTQNSLLASILDLNPVYRARIAAFDVNKPNDQSLLLAVEIPAMKQEGQNVPNSDQKVS